MEDTADLGEEEAVLRLKLRHMRTAHRELARAAERDGLFGPELLALEAAVKAVARAMDTELQKRRESR